MPPKFTPDFQPTLLKNSIQPLKLTFTGLSPSTAEHSSSIQLHLQGHKLSLITPHLPKLFIKGFSLFYTVFDRLY